MLMYSIKPSYWNCRMILNRKLFFPILKFNFNVTSFSSTLVIFSSSLVLFQPSEAWNQRNQFQFSPLLYFIAETMGFWFLKLVTLLSFSSFSYLLQRSFFSAVSLSGMIRKKLKNLNWNYIATFHDRITKTT